LVKKLPQKVCDQCGRPFNVQPKCPACQYDAPSYDELRSWAFYEGPVRKAIHSLKYRGDITLGEILARPLINIIERQAWVSDFVLPVPMGEKRLSSRGYNQATLLARPVAYAIGKPFFPKALRKIRETSTQVGLSFSERLENVKGAFQAAVKNVHGMSVLIVDDVTTSGATMEACACALKKAGAIKVYGLTIARTRFDSYQYV
jgi:ComF family protein